jgi:acid phosphatase (class A)
MRQKTWALILTVSLSSATLPAQIQHLESGAAAAKPARVAYFIDGSRLNFTLILPNPPGQNSQTTRVELAELHRIEASRTPQQIAAAQADDREQDIFIFKRLFGEDFNAASLPLTAALSAHIHNDESVVSKPLKSSFSRPRPFQFDPTLHPVCELNKEPNSYPSGHTLSGYLLAFTLAQMVPEKRVQILERADDYAHNRLVCGVHYLSDVQASQDLAYLIFGAMLSNPNFQRDLAAARQEIRQHLGLAVTTAHT